MTRRVPRRSLGSRRFRRGVVRRVRRGVSNRGRMRVNRRQVLNVTSVKKQDNMGAWGTDIPGEVFESTVLASQTEFTPACVVWCPTARERASPSHAARMTRTKKEVFWRGVSERLTLKFSGSDPWYWRRIVLQAPSGAVSVTSNNAIRSTTNPDYGGVPPDTTRNESGVFVYGRNIQFLDLASGDIGPLLAALRMGSANVDTTNSGINTRVNPERFKIMYDRRVQLKSGNDAGHMTERKLWHPFNRTMRYDDNEYGSTFQSSQYAMETPNLGLLKDVYIIDMFQSLPGSADTMLYSCEATAYWHER